MIRSGNSFPTESPESWKPAGRPAAVRVARAALGFQAVSADRVLKAVTVGAAAFVLRAPTEIAGRTVFKAAPAVRPDSAANRTLNSTRSANPSKRRLLLPN